MRTGLNEFPVEQVRAIRDCVVTFLSRMPPQMTAAQMLMAIAYEEAQTERETLNKDQMQ